MNGSMGDPLSPSKEHPVPTSVLTPLFLVPYYLGFLLPLFFFFNIANETAVSSFLRTLVVAETSVVAVVFSIVILGVQVISSRYSARMGKIVFEDELFRFTVILLSIAILMDLALILTIPDFQSGSPVLSGIYLWFVGISIGLSGVAYWSLAFSIKSLVRQSTPEGVLNAYETRTTTESIFDEITGEGSVASPPFEDLHSFLRASLDNGERKTAQDALELYLSEVESLIHHFSDGELSGLPYGSKQSMLSDIFTNKIPEISETAKENGYYDLSLYIREQLWRLANYWNSSEGEYRAELIQSQIQYIRGIPDDSIQQEAVQRLMYELAESASVCDDEQLLQYFRILRKSISQEYGPVPDQTELAQLMEYLPAINRRLIDKQNSITQYYPRSNSLTVAEEIKDSITPTEEFHKLTVELSYKLIISENEQYPTEVANAWMHIAKDMSYRHGSTQISQLSQILVELSIIHSEKGGRIDPWVDSLSALLYHTHVGRDHHPADDVRANISLETDPGLFTSTAMTGVDLRETSYTLDRSVKETDEFLQELKESSDRKYIQRMYTGKGNQELLNQIMYHLDYIEEGISLTGKIQHGSDLLICEDREQRLILVKLVHSVNPIDREDVLDMYSSLYGNVVRDTRDIVGPVPYRLALITPDFDPDTAEEFENTNIKIIDFTTDLAKKTRMSSQSNLSDFEEEVLHAEYPDQINEGLHE